MNVLFFGTPDIAVPFLEWLDEHHQVVGVVCQPDKPVGRGYEVQPPPVKVFAQQKRLPLFQPAGKWDDTLVNQLKKTGADVGLAVAYGRIMPEPVFKAPRLGTLNIHFSLLPKYRGAAPMQWALVNGESETGVSIFWLEKEMDSGPLFKQAAIKIERDDDARTLESKLVHLGLVTLREVFRELEAGKISKIPQAGTPTFASLLKKEHGIIDWTKPAEVIVNQIRGLREWPVASASYRAPDGSTKKLKIFKASHEPGRGGTGQPGQIVDAARDKGIIVQTGTDCIFLLEIQPEGKKPMPAWAFWQGGQLKRGDKFI